LATPDDPYSAQRHAGHLSAIRYAPNVRGLRRCRETARELAGRADSLLAVDVPDGFGLAAESRLRYVGRETDEATARWTGTGARPVHGCTWDRFRAAADDFSVWHRACHGSADPGSIMDTRLYFADRDVSLADLRRTLRPGRRRLAVLSACETNLTDPAVPNEVIGLPSALLQVGFAGVVAAAWRVDDLATAYLMTAFYHWWRQKGEQPAVALNQAQVWMRTARHEDLRGLMPGVEPRGGPGEYPYADPRYWAAFAYTGA
jgi:CHAT domain-containing protein